MKRFISLLAVAALMATMLASSAVPALASPLGGASKGGFGLADCSYLRGTVIVVDGEFVCKQADPYAVYYY